MIASLTSWTKRINTAHLAVQTILAHSRPADLTVLYLAEEEFPNREKDLPRELPALRSDKIVMIFFCESGKTPSPIDINVRNKKARRS